MKAYKLEILIIDHDGCGAESIIQEIENQRYANDCITPQVMKIIEKDIGKWTDDHPLNSTETCGDEYQKLFEKGKK